ncbi:MAG: hypothetical protein ACP5TH_04390 [Fervidicoccaceae archaeon]
MSEYRRGDQEIINFLKNLISKKIRVCFISSYRRLALYMQQCSKTM